MDALPISKNSKIQKQIEGWSKLYSKLISKEEYKEICHNLDDLFSILKKWDDVERKSDEIERNSNKRNINLSN